MVCSITRETLPLHIIIYIGVVYWSRGWQAEVYSLIYLNRAATTGVLQPDWVSDVSAYGIMPTVDVAIEMLNEARY